MYEIMRLSGQEYVDKYASTVKTKLLTSSKPKKADEPKPDDEQTQESAEAENHKARPESE